MLILEETEERELLCSTCSVPYALHILILLYFSNKIEKLVFPLFHTKEVHTGHLANEKQEIELQPWSV